MAAVADAGALGRLVLVAGGVATAPISVSQDHLRFEGRGELECEGGVSSELDLFSLH